MRRAFVFPPSFSQISTNTYCMNECFNSSFIYGHCSSYQEAKKCCRSCGAVWTFVTLKFIEAGKDWVGGGGGH